MVSFFHWILIKLEVSCKNIDEIKKEAVKRLKDDNNDERRTTAHNEAPKIAAKDEAKVSVKCAVSTAENVSNTDMWEVKFKDD